MNDRAIDLLTVLATKNTSETIYVTYYKKSWNIATEKPELGKSALVDRANIRASIESAVNRFAEVEVVY
jgi:hypothetical protein